MSKLAGISRAALLGTLCAMVAFSYAIATVESASVVDSVDARGVGTNQLRFTNAKLNNDRDLGLVALGGSFTRFARAAGGLPPYTFSSPTATTEFGITRFVGSTLVSGAVDFSGKVSGVVGTLTTANFQSPLNNALRFNIKVVDQTVGTAGVTESFVLTIDQTGDFKFADGPDLGTTVRFQDFNSVVETINGKGSISYAVSGVALTGFTGIANLSEVGLFIDRSGKIFGKPYLPGTLTFTVEATDSTGAKAKARNGTGTSQTFTLLIEPSVDITSDIVVQKATVKYDQVKSTKKAGDSVQISGLLNVKGAKISDFNTKKFSTQIGNFVSPEVTLDAKGKAKSTDKLSTAQVSTKGTFKATYKGLNFSALFATPVVADKGSQTYATAVSLSASVSSVDPLVYIAKGTFPKQQLSYSLGKNAAPAGAFLITKVSGKNSKDGAGTAFKADFIGLPGSLVKSVAGTFTGVSKAAVSIGNVTDSTLAATLKGSKVSAKSKSKANNTVKSLSLDGIKGKGKVDTNTFVAGATGTGIPVATDGLTTKFPLAVTVQNSTSVALYNGIGSASIFGKKTSYVSVNPAK